MQKSVSFISPGSDIKISFFEKMWCYHIYSSVGFEQNPAQSRQMVVLKAQVLRYLQILALKSPIDNIPNEIFLIYPYEILCDFQVKITPASAPPNTENCLLWVYNLKMNFSCYGQSSKSCMARIFLDK